MLFLLNTTVEEKAVDIYLQGEHPMKTFVFTAILLILFGVTWTLFLEYSNKRFTDNLPKAYTMNTFDVGNVEDPAMQENNETIVGDAGVSNPCVDINQVKGAHMQTHAHKHPPANDSESTNIHQSEETSFETQGTLNAATPRPTASEANPSLDFVLAEERTARETILRIMNNSQNWMHGEPGKSGFILGLTKSDMEEMSKANAVLNPGSENQRVPYRADSENMQAEITSETHDLVPLNRGYRIYLPNR